MSNKLTSSKYPFLPLSIHVRVSHRKKIDITTQVLIDTGFSGDIVVPATEELKQCPPNAYATWTMADGSEVMTPIFLGFIRFPELEVMTPIFLGFIRFPELDEDVAEMVGVTVTVLLSFTKVGLH
jgi:predicted aspartyl protease